MLGVQPDPRPSTAQLVWPQLVQKEMSVQVERKSRARQIQDEDCRMHVIGASAGDAVLNLAHRPTTCQIEIYSRDNDRLSIPL